MLLKFPFFNPVKGSCMRWIEKNDEPFAEAVTKGENDPLISLLTIARLFRFTKTYKACLERLERCGYVVPSEVRMKSNGYRVQRKMRNMEEMITEAWDDYFVNGRLVRKGNEPCQRNLTFDERDNLIKLLEDNKDIKGYESIVAKLKVEPVKGGLRKKDLTLHKR